MNGCTERGPKVPVYPCVHCQHRVCADHLSADGRAADVWRPWQITPKDIEREQQRQMENLNFSTDQSQQMPTEDKEPAIRHPVKLFWPKSKCFDYLYEDAAYLLANFPVQATISFYQESDSESESEGDE
ncbi:protein ripply2.1-like [Rhinoraja longicauda]